jgi:hypothetical protein
MIEPLETLIKHYKADPAIVALVGTRIATRHQYGLGWSIDAASLVVQLDGGIPELYVEDHRQRYELRLYAQSYISGLDLWRALLANARATRRALVSTSSGSALLREITVEALPGQYYDEETGLPFLLCFVTALIAETAIT